MRPLLYIQVNKGHFVAKRLGSDRVIRKECAGLTHPRTLMGDFFSVQESFAAAIKELLPRLNLLKPRGLIHLLPAYDGGYTNVETRAFKEAGEMAGINFSHMSTLDRPHTDSEAREILSDR